MISCWDSKQMYSYLQCQYVVWDTACTHMQSLANHSDLFKSISYTMLTKSKAFLTAEFKNLYYSQFLNNKKKND